MSGVDSCVSLGLHNVDTAVPPFFFTYLVVHHHLSEHVYVDADTNADDTGGGRPQGVHSQQKPTESRSFTRTCTWT